VLQPGGTGSITMTVTASNDADVHGASIKVTAVGDNADFVTVEPSFAVGDVGAGDTVEVLVPVTVSADFPCGSSLVLSAELSADDAPTVTEQYRAFPGTRTLFEESFNDDDDNFAVNDNDTDDASSGALSWTSVSLSCDMTKRTPERDATADGTGAYLTGPGTDHEPNLLDGDPGEGSELEGLTSMSSPPVDLTGTSSPFVRFSYWLDGSNGDSLTVELSGDNEATFVEARTYVESSHQWVTSFVDVAATFPEALPKDIIIRFSFRGGGALEGGIDDVRVVEPTGSCEVRKGICGCDQSGQQPAPWSMAVVAFAAYAVLRRRRS
jgi:MYXO-CTERM domain-containing protein